MKREQLELSAAKAVAVIKERYGEMAVLVIGSQSILATWDETQLPATATMSAEIDLVPLRETADEAVSTLVDIALGMDSDFHSEHGFYVHGVGADTAYLPRGWETRLVPLGGVDNVLCLDPHDMCAAKLMRFEPRDKDFVISLIRIRLIDPSVLVERVTSIDFTVMERPEVGPIALEWTTWLSKR